MQAGRAWSSSERSATARPCSRCRSLRPDVVVLDEALDGGGRALRCRSLREEGVAVAAVVLTDRTDGASVLHAPGWARVVTCARRPGSPRSGPPCGPWPTAVGRSSRSSNRRPSGPRRFADRPGRGPRSRPLTAREHEILMLVSQGMTMQQVARRLGISPRTVETHVAKLYRKLGAPPRAGGRSGGPAGSDRTLMTPSRRSGRGRSAADSSLPIGRRVSGTGRRFHVHPEGTVSPRPTTTAPRARRLGVVVVDPLPAFEPASRC